MTFEPQIPTWGDEYKSYTEKLKYYHDWLCTTGINTGLILNNIENKEQNIYDLGTGGGIPGVPVAITNQNKLFTLVDISESRVFELQRLKKYLI